MQFSMQSFMQLNTSTIVGDSVSASAFAGSGTAIVTNPGVEFIFTAGNGEVDTIDLFSSSILFSVAAPSGASNWSFSGAGGDVFTISGIDVLPALSQIIGVSFLTPFSSNGVTASNLTFSDSPLSNDGIISFQIDGSMINTSTPSTWMLNLTYSQVPEPSSIALLALGFAGLGFSQRKTKAL